MRVVFLCNRLSRTRLRGSWLAQLCDTQDGEKLSDSLTNIATSLAVPQHNPNTDPVSTLHFNICRKLHSVLKQNNH